MGRCTCFERLVEDVRGCAECQDGELGGVRQGVQEDTEL